MVRVDLLRSGALALSLAQATSAFYIPGWSIKSFQPKERIPLLVNKAYSDNTQIQYAYDELPFVCPPNEGITLSAGGLRPGQHVPLNLGEILRGDRIVASDILLEMGQDKNCVVLCERTVTYNDLEWSKSIIEDGYVVEWIVDNLPGATSFVTADKSKKHYASGFPLGYLEMGGDEEDEPKYFLNNHFTIVIRHRQATGRDGEDGGRLIVGFEIYPKSVGMENNRDEHGCPTDLQTVSTGFELAMPSDKNSSSLNNLFDPDDDVFGQDETMQIPFTYSVFFREDETIEWAHRWDLYLVDQEDGAHIHWMAIINSVFICGLLTGVVLLILAKTVRSDIKSYKEAAIEGGKLRKKPRSKKERPTGLLGQETSDGDELAEDDFDEDGLEDVTGWKLLHADVFRAPAHLSILSPLIGSGVQLLFTTAGLIGLSAAGVLNPSFRGGFISVGIGLFIFASLFSGYFSARVYKAFGGEDYRMNALFTAALFPGILFALIFLMNLLVWANASSTALPFFTLVGVLFLWAFFQVPLVYVGSWFGHKKASTWEHPTRTASLPRQIPPQAWYTQSLQAVLLAGLLPFAVIFIELLFVFQSLWQDKSGYYYVFGFLAVVCLILAVSVAEVTIVAVYIQLGSENYNWQWQSFFVGGGSALWVFLYSVWYYFFKLHVTGFVSTILFFAYSAGASIGYGLVTGSIGFLAAYAFVRRIYRAIKAD